MRRKETFEEVLDKVINAAIAYNRADVLQHSWVHINKARYLRQRKRLIKLHGEWKGAKWIELKPKKAS